MRPLNTEVLYTVPHFEMHQLLN